MKGRLTNAQAREKQRQVKNYNVKMAAQTVREDKRAAQRKRERLETMLWKRLDARRNGHAV